MSYNISTYNTFVLFGVQPKRDIMQLNITIGILLRDLSQTSLSIFKIVEFYWTKIR